MPTQGELFRDDAPIVPGVTFVPDAIRPAEEQTLATLVDAAPLEPFQFGRWRGKRMTVHYGSAYDFSRGRLGDAPPLPGWLIELRDKLGPLVRLDPRALQAALLIRYDPGAGIGWHRDRPQYDEVLGLSLGANCTMRLRRRSDAGFERRSLPLPARSLYRLTGEVRWEWEHSIAPMEQTRWSITFRSLRKG